jgi:isoleucyl-tRNA synthetase
MNAIHPRRTGMVATLGGLLALPLGLAVLLLPLLATELSRPRDSAWGALVLLLGLVLVTSADRLSGAPMLGVVCAALLIGRLGLEVGQGRWRQLSDGERQRLVSAERWSTSLHQLGTTLAGASQQLGSAAAGLGARLGQGRAGAGPSPGEAPATKGSAAGGRGRAKRWVRPEPAPAAAEPTEGAETAAAPSIAPPTAEPTSAEASTDNAAVGDGTAERAAALGAIESASGSAGQSPAPSAPADGSEAPAADHAEPGLPPPTPQA